MSERRVPSKEQWAAIEKALSCAYGRAELQCDAFKVSLVVVRAKAMRYEIMVYVDGIFKGTMIAHDCEERRRFMRPRSKQAFGAKAYKSWRRAFGKKDADERQARGLHRYFEAWWPSVGPLKRHLLANNTNIELLESTP